MPHNVLGWWGFGDEDVGVLSGYTGVEGTYPSEARVVSADLTV